MGFLHRNRWLTPYLLLAPGLAGWGSSSSSRSASSATSRSSRATFGLGYKFTWAWHNFWDAISTYHPQLIRSFEYAGIATVLALLLSYPLVVLDRVPRRPLEEPAAAVHHRAVLRHVPDPDARVGDDPGRRRVGRPDHPGRAPARVLGDGGHVLASPTAVVAGITYNFLPFMALPLYVSLEQIDQRLIEAARISTRASRRRSCG